MIIVKLNNGDSIEKALKRFKRKFTMTKAIDELRERESFVKPSQKKREIKKRAVYRQKKRMEEERNS